MIHVTWLFWEFLYMLMRCYDIICLRVLKNYLCMYSMKLKMWHLNSWNSCIFCMIYRIKGLGCYTWLGRIGHFFMLKAHECAILCQITCLFVFLGVCFHIRCLRPWEHNFFICNVFIGLLNLNSMSSQSLHKSSNVLLCRFAWVLLELHENTLELLCFRKN